MDNTHVSDNLVRILITVYPNTYIIHIHLKVQRKLRLNKLQLRICNLIHYNLKETTTNKQKTNIAPKI